MKYDGEIARFVSNFIIFKNQLYSTELSNKNLF